MVKLSSPTKRHGLSSSRHHHRMVRNGTLLFMAGFVLCQEVFFAVFVGPSRRELVGLTTHHTKQSQLRSFKSPAAAGPTMENVDNVLQQQKKNSVSPYRFQATAKMLSYSDNNNTTAKSSSLNSQLVDSIRITTPQEVARYRRERQDIIPLDEPLVYFITPTHATETQMADLTLLGQTLFLDGNIYWIVVEDAASCSERIRILLDRIGLPYAHVHATTNKPVNKKRVPPHRGIDQRNRALQVIEALLFMAKSSKEENDNNNNNNNKSVSNSTIMEGIVYFGDDDNTYDVHLFPVLRQTKTIGVLPVGFVGGGPYERCIVHPKTGKITTIASAYMSKRRKFPIDMAGFCLHTSVIQRHMKHARFQQHADDKNKNTTTTTDKEPGALTGPRFRWTAGAGQLETSFLEQVAHDMRDLNPLADNCTKVYVWHTKSVAMNALINRNHKKYGSNKKTTTTGFKPSPDVYLDGIGKPPEAPVFPAGMEDFAARVGGRVSSSSQSVSRLYDTTASRSPYLPPTHAKAFRGLDNEQREQDEDGERGKRIDA